MMPAPIKGLRSVAFQTVHILGRTSLVLTRSAHAANVLLGRFRVRGEVRSRRGFGRRGAIRRITTHVGTNRGVTLMSSTNAPTVSSPKFVLIHRYMHRNMRIRYLPKTATFIPTLITSKLPGRGFYFRNFLPRGGKERAHLGRLSARCHAVVFCRSPFQLIGALARLTRFFKGSHPISMSHRVSGVRRRAMHNALRRIVTRFAIGRPGNRVIVMLTNLGSGGSGRAKARIWHGGEGGVGGMLVTAAVYATVLTSYKRGSTRCGGLGTRGSSLEVRGAGDGTRVSRVLKALGSMRTSVRSVHSTRGCLGVRRRGKSLGGDGHRRVGRGVRLVDRALGGGGRRVDRLRRGLGGDKVRSSTLEGAVDHLSSRLSRGTGVVIALRRSLTGGGIHVRRLSRVITSLGRSIRSLSAAATTRSRGLRRRSGRLRATCCYFNATGRLGSRGVLSNNNLFTGSGMLRDNFGGSCFVSVSVHRIGRVPLFTNGTGLGSGRPRNSCRFIGSRSNGVALGVASRGTF